MSKGIGEIIAELREESGYTQRQLCEGICSVSELAKIESNQFLPGYFQADRLFARMGKGISWLQYVLPKDIYELYELQYLVQESISRLELEKAEEILCRYEQKKQAGSMLHRQFTGQERAQIAWMRGAKTETVLRLLNQAIECTMKPEAIQGGNAISAEELKLLLFRWEVSKGTKWERERRELSEVLDYLQQHTFDEEEKVKVYPYAVLLLTEEMDMEKEYREISCLLDTSLELLRKRANILYMPETLEKYADILEYGKDSKYVKTLRNWRSSLLKLEEEFGVDLEKYRLFCNLNRFFEVDCEVIRQERKASGFSQEMVSEGICTPESLSRIENGKRSPSNRNMGALLGKIRRRRERMHPRILAERYGILELERQFRRYLNYYELEKAEEVLQKLEEKADADNIENKQYIMAEKVRLALLNEKISYETGIEKLYEILKMTMPDKTKLYEYHLTFRERNILNAIACQYSQNDRKEEAAKIWEKLLMNEEKSIVSRAYRMSDWELMTANLARTMNDLERSDAVVELCNRRLHMEFSIGGGEGIGVSVQLRAFALERKQVKNYEKDVRQALDLINLLQLN